jgi:hypothetical protein
VREDQNRLKTRNGVGKLRDISKSPAATLEIRLMGVYGVKSQDEEVKGPRQIEELMPNCGVS